MEYPKLPVLRGKQLPLKNAENMTSYAIKHSVKRTASFTQFLYM